LNNPAAIKQFTKVIKDENQRLNNQVEKILQAAVLDKKALAFKKEGIDLHELIEVLAQVYQLKLKPNDEFTLQLKAGKAVVTGDKFHLSNAISNLLDNAIKYAKQEPHTIIIEVETNQQPEGVSISITDNGIGISKENQTQVFDKFYRVPNGNIHNVKGFGLGLSYVKEIVQQHKGTIQVQSKLQQNTTFTLFLPYEN